MFRGLINSHPAFWLFLSLPAWPVLIDLWPQDRYFAETMNITGVLSAQLLVLTLAVTPVTQLVKRWAWGRVAGRWLVSRRRYLGLASAGYALLHTLHYLRYENDFGSIVIEAFDFEFSVGWTAMLIFIPLAVTSNAWSVRALGRYWKTLQRLVYLVAAATFVHWWMFDRRPEDLYMWGAALIAAKLLQVALFRR